MISRSRWPSCSHFSIAAFRAIIRFSRIKLTPSMPGGPEVWLLGSSMWSASAAAQFGLPYAFAHFIDQQPTRSAIEYYRSHFAPSDYLKAPHGDCGAGSDLRRYQ